MYKSGSMPSDYSEIWSQENICSGKMIICWGSFPGKMCHGNLALLKENFSAIYGEKIFVDVSFILDKK